MRPVRRRDVYSAILAVIILALITVNSHADIVDFEEFGNGDKLDGSLSLLAQPSNVSFPVTMSTVQSDGMPIATVAAIFDTDSGGGNAGMGDDDLIVNQGNSVIIQNLTKQTMNGAMDAYTMPDDSAGGGKITIDFGAQPVRFESILLIDIDASAAATITLTDGGGNTRVYEVPDQWTGEVGTPENNPGFGTLDLTTLSPQVGPNLDNPPSAIVGTGVGTYDPNDARSIMVNFSGSGAFTDVEFTAVPEPSAVFGLALISACIGGQLYWRRRSKSSAKR